MIFSWFSPMRRPVHQFWTAEAQPNSPLHPLTGSIPTIWVSDQAPTPIYLSVCEDMGIPFLEGDRPTPFRDVPTIISGTVVTE